MATGGIRTSPALGNAPVMIRKRTFDAAESTQTSPRMAKNKMGLRSYSLDIHSESIHILLDYDERACNDDSRICHRRGENMIGTKAYFPKSRPQDIRPKSGTLEINMGLRPPVLIYMLEQNFTHGWM